MSIRRLKKKLDKKGYVLVARSRHFQMRNMEASRDSYYKQYNNERKESERLQDEVNQLKAEIEGHKRVQEVLATKAVEAQIARAFPDPKGDLWGSWGRRVTDE